MPNTLLLVALVVFAPDVAPAAGEQDAPPTPTLSELIEEIVRSSLPESFEDQRHWNKREEVFSGFKVRGDGLDVRISKRERTVKHGFWRKYTVRLLNPQETFRLHVRRWQPVGQGRYTFQVVAEVRARVEARFEHWNLGVKLLNGSTEADASLRMIADCSLHWEMVRDEELGPVIQLSPDVAQVELQLRDLDLRKFGELRGSIAKELGDGLTDPIEDLLQTQEKSVRRQADKEIAQHRDDLRLPLARVFNSPWSALLWAQ